MTIEETIQSLTERLADADAPESARIRTRIIELEALKKDHDTT